MKTIFKKSLSVLLATLMIVSFLPVMSQAGATNDTEYISSVALAYGHARERTKEYLTEAGYTPVGMDFNYGAGGKYVFMGVRYSENPDEAIRAFRIQVSKRDHAPNAIVSDVNGKKATFYKVGAGAVDYLPNDVDGSVELNKGAGGEDLFLYATRDKNAGQPITEIVMTSNPVRDGFCHATSFQNTSAPQNCNAGANGDSVFLHWFAEDKTVPDGYWFKRDSYGFRNYGADIDKKYFYLMFGMPAGFSMWAIKHNQERGLCFGMAYTAASLLNSMPAINNMRGSFPAASSSIEIAYRKMTIEDYIKFAHIYQFDLECIAKTFFPTNAKEIYNQVKENVENDSIGLTIRIARKNGKGAHQVLPVGINQNNILIYDSNNTTNLEYLTVNDDGTWYYSGSTAYNSTTCDLTIYSDYMRPYQKLLLLHLYDWYEAAKLVVSENALLTIKNDCNIGTADLVEIMPESNGESEQSTAKQYWLLSDKSVTVSNTSNGANEFSLAGNEFVVGASVNDNSEVTLTADEKNDVKIKSVAGNEYSVSFIGFGEKCEALKTEITGVANGSEVTAAKTENGVVVTGLNNLSIVYSEDDVEVGNATAEVKDGREVNVTVDKNDDTVKTDFVGEKNENACGYCGKVHGTSFAEVLIKFFHKIFCFFAKLFGTRK